MQSLACHADGTDPPFLKEARSLPHTLYCTSSLVFKALIKMIILCLFVCIMVFL